MRSEDHHDHVQKVEETLRFIYLVFKSCRLMLLLYPRAISTNVYDGRHSTTMEVALGQSSGEEIVTIDIG